MAAVAISHFRPTDTVLDKAAEAIRADWAWQRERGQALMSGLRPKADVPEALGEVMEPEVLAAL